MNSLVCYQIFMFFIPIFYICDDMCNYREEIY